MISLSLAFALAVAPPPAMTSADRLQSLVSEYDAWRYYEFPEMARERGVDVGRDRITDQTPVAERRRRAQRAMFLEELQEIPTDGLSEEDRLDRSLFELVLRNAIESYDRNEWMEPVGPVYGPQQRVPQLAEKLRFDTAEDYENYLKQLTWVPSNLAAAEEAMRAGLERGMTPPKVILEGVPAQFDRVVHGGLESLRDPFRRMPATIPAERQNELRAEFENDVFPPIVEAMNNLGGFVRDVYVPQCRESVAACDEPGGCERYHFRLRAETTLAMTPEEIHQLGLREVARLRAEMLEVIRTTDWYGADSARAKLDEDELFRAFVAYLRTDPRFYFTKADDLITGYRDICKRVDAHLPSLFGTLPRLTYGVRPIPSFMAPSQTTAYYMPGSIPNGDPGWFYVNTYALDMRPTYEMVPLSLHEAVPGHHLQIALAQELPDVREFRRDLDSTAFVEGWALYAERLGIEMGLYDDPYDNFGRLLYEMWRSCRLVVDPGIHALGWSRERAVQYMLDNTALSELNIRNEVDRYIAWPGQACAYKLGELTIRRLRDDAEAALGARFSLRRFHDCVLGAGPLPLPVLEERVRRWIAQESEPAPG